MRLLILFQVSVSQLIAPLRRPGSSRCYGWGWNYLLSLSMLRQSLTHFISLPSVGPLPLHPLSRQYSICTATVYDLFLLMHEMRLYVECSGAIYTLRENVPHTLSCEPAIDAHERLGRSARICYSRALQRPGRRDATGHESTLAYHGHAVVPHPEVGKSQLAAEFPPR